MVRAGGASLREAVSTATDHLVVVGGGRDGGGEGDRVIEGDGSATLSRDFATVAVYRSQRGNQGSDVC